MCAFLSRNKKPLQNRYELLGHLLLAAQLAFLALNMHFSISLIPIAFAPDAASEKSVSRSVLEASSLIKTNSLKEFSLSMEHIRGDAGFTQRMCEYNYPARFKSTSSIVIAGPDEKEFEKCNLIGKSALISIYDCANKTH